MVVIVRSLRRALGPGNLYMLFTVISLTMVYVLDKFL